ncbi:MAG: hypothetical protein J3Q66DRAFT_55266 [Benniella sp.]|nr:MAG: hypothetical protein J3Q66DRAFT_55266 [Benniella sp.]
MESIPDGLRLVACCMLLGQCSLTMSIDELLSRSEHIRSTLLALSHDEVTKNVAFTLHDILSDTMNKQDRDQLKTQVTSFLDVLSEIPYHTLDMVTRYTILFPELLLPELLKRIQLTCPWSQPTGEGHVAVFGATNAINVVINLIDKEFFLTALSEDTLHQRRLLEKALIELLQNKDITVERVRLPALALESETVFKALSSELISDDVVTRSRAESIMIEYLLCQRENRLPENAFDSFVDYIRCVSRSTGSRSQLAYKITSPTQLYLRTKSISSDPRPQNTQDAVLEALFNLVKNIGDSIPHNLWNRLLYPLVLKTCAFPADHHLIRIWNSLAPSLAGSPMAITSLSNALVNLMEHQGMLSEDLLESALETTDEALEDLRLARLSPLLVLKAMPAFGFARLYKNGGGPTPLEVNIRDRMSKSLISRYENKLEFSLVRTLAKAVFHGMFPDSTLEAIFSGITKCLATQPADPLQLDLVEVRSWLFTLYDWVVNWTIESRSSEENNSSTLWIYRIVFEHLFVILSLHNYGSASQDLYKVQLGVTDVLAKTLLVTGPCYLDVEKTRCQDHSTASRMFETGISLNTDIDESTSTIPKTPGELFMALLQESLNRITEAITEQNEAHVTTAACLINAYIMAFQNAASLNSPSPALSTLGMGPNMLSRGASTMAWIPRAFSDVIAPRLCKAVTLYLQDHVKAKGNGMVPLIQGCVQILYTGVSLLGLSGESVTSSHCMMNVVVCGLESDETSIIIAALKLLATMIGARIVEPERVSQTDMVSVRRRLAQLHQSCEMQKATYTPELMSLLDKVYALLS